ncbi:MAG: thioredoxin family protein [Streptococcus sp.]|nr:thioredoxin family protein [Streptococcus sp.]
MILPNSYEEIAEHMASDGKVVLYFSADWCGDCHFIYPVMPEIEKENPEFTFIKIDRDKFMDLAQKLDVFGIPSFIVLENGVEVGRFVNRLRKSKEEIAAFLAEYK